MTTEKQIRTATFLTSGVVEVRGGWGTVEHGPITPGSVIEVADDAADWDGALAVVSAGPRLVVCGRKDVLPGDKILGRVVSARPPGAPLVDLCPEEAGPPAGREETGDDGD